jgi:transcriptional regulator with XRE-family HTH domain
MELGQRIEAAYTAKGFNQRQAALKLGWSAQRLANYVNGRAPDLGSLLKIANEFDTTPNELLGISGQSDSELLDILRRLLELEGLPAHRAGTIAEAAIATQKLLRSLPGAPDSPDRPAIAAQAIWTARSDSTSDKSPRP